MMIHTSITGLVALGVAVSNKALLKTSTAILARVGSPAVTTIPSSTLHVVVMAGMASRFQIR